MRGLGALLVGRLLLTFLVSDDSLIGMRVGTGHELAP